MIDGQDELLLIALFKVEGCYNEVNRAELDTMLEESVFKGHAYFEDKSKRSVIIDKVFVEQ